ncbi:hypothetical protein LGH82_04955 [Mesorhizobium sp. PAMC28654]|uniref:hypothetical protein n=1 Tax=Mesorhizobium sp. PAMC28654 TaxID=2880934 RepID=UPI001D0AD8D2|nr:hypothetical protein [Mesorhizobium sp. PAMC28654]UDL90682.1 hypothetical protein LGH82_04955 [Mesorhizobium sp. PAMC28654]
MMKPNAWRRLADEPHATTVIDVQPIGVADETVRVVVYTRDVYHGVAALAALRSAITEIIQGVTEGTLFGAQDQNGHLEYEWQSPMANAAAREHRER